MTGGMIHGNAAASVPITPAPATGPANPPLRQRLRVEILLAAVDRRTRESSDLRDDGETAATGGPYLGRRKQAPPALVKLRADRVPS